jgi:threonine/homoserine/homoserine lactone efflux protein
MDLGIQNIWLFVVAGWALNLTPGPDVFYMVTPALCMWQRPLWG